MAAPSTEAALRSTPLFSSFTETGLQIFAQIASPHDLPAETPLFEQRQEGDALFVLVSGVVRLSICHTGGTPRAIGELQGPDTLGEMALIRVGPRLCTATLVSDARVLILTRRDVGRLQQQKPQACIKLFMCIAERLGERVREAGDELSGLIMAKGPHA
jgi:CRP/FNR family transcriptional regulator, cyclic AMP receptor protein